MVVTVAMPECGWIANIGLPVGTTTAWSRNTNGLINSPISEGLARRVISPCLLPPVRKAIRRGAGVVSGIKVRTAAALFMALPKKYDGGRVRARATSEKPIFLEQTYRLERWI